MESSHNQIILAYATAQIKFDCPLLHGELIFGMMRIMSHLYGGIEAGGTKFVCAVGTGPADLELTRFPTTTPAETFSRAIDFFKQESTRGVLAAIGIASFGPVDPNPASPTFGYITSTPKPGWEHANFVGPIKQALGLPVGFDTYVNAAALGEHRWGAGRDSIISSISPSAPASAAGA